MASVQGTARRSPLSRLGWLSKLLTTMDRTVWGVIFDFDKMQGSAAYLYARARLLKRFDICGRCAPAPYPFTGLCPRWRDMRPTSAPFGPTF
jgi:hypothetical protein